MSGFLRSILGAPVAFLYRIATIVDRSLKLRSAYRSTLPIVSVGNISTGGSGKTQVVRALLSELQRSRPVIVLARGYGRRDSGDRIWRPGTSPPDPQLFGDEPAMLASFLLNGAIGVASERARLLRHLEPELRDAIVILDDGFQHHRIRRDFDLVIVDGATAESSRMLPAGRLREHPSALTRADAILVDSPEADRFARLWAPEVPRCTMRIESHRIVSLSTGSGAPSGMPLLVTGIARPERVRRSLAELGIDAADEINFRDHQNYGASEIRKILSTLKSSGANWIVTTAKDAVKLAGIPEVCDLLYVLEVEMVIDELPELMGMIAEKIVQSSKYRVVRS